MWMNKTLRSQSVEDRTVYISCLNTSQRSDPPCLSLSSARVGGGRLEGRQTQLNLRSVQLKARWR